MLEALDIVKLNIQDIFGSEHGKAHHCHRYLRQNFNHEVMYFLVLKNKKYIMGKHIVTKKIIHN